MQSKFSRRELETAYFLLQGMPDREIAERIGVTTKVIKNQVIQIARKLGIPPYGKYAIRVRIVYVICYMEGLLDGWPEPPHHPARV